MIIGDEEIFLIDHDEYDAKQMVYVPLRSYLAIAEREIMDKVLFDTNSKENTQFFGKLKKLPLLSMEEIIGNLHSAIPELSLAITDNCNLYCVYCHASAGEDHKQNTMTTEMIDSILTKYFEFIGNRKVVKISFNGGGEPTYNFKRLVYAVNKAKSLANQSGAQCIFSMATNGFYGDAVRQFIIENFSEISLSFDGPEFIHNQHRPTKTGDGSFAMVYATAKYFYNTSLPFAFRATISNISIQHIEEIIDFIAAEFPNKSIGLEHMNMFGRAKNSNVVLPPNIDEFSDKIVYLLDYIKGKPIPNWTVNVSGAITACARDDTPDEFVFGNYDHATNTLTLDEEKISGLRRMVVTNYTECENCFCKYHCAGDCPDRRLEEKYDCNSIRKIGKHILQDKLSTSKVKQHASTISAPHAK